MKESLPQEQKLTPHEVFERLSKLSESLASIHEKLDDILRRIHQGQTEPADSAEKTAAVE